MAQDQDRITDAGSRTLGELSAICRDPGNARAWDNFLSRYRPRVLAYCEALGLRSADAEEVTQNILIKLYKELPRRTLRHERDHFTGWLKTLIRHTVLDHHRRLQRRGMAGLDPVVMALLEAPDPGPVEVLIQMEKELALREALARVGGKVLSQNPRHWEAFNRVESGEGSAEVAAALNMTVGAVNTCRYRIRRMIAEELGRDLDEV